MLREGQDFPFHLCHDAGLVLGAAVLQHVLNDVVPVLVLHQLVGVVMQLLQNGLRLLCGAVLQDPLDNPAAVGVRGQLEHLGRDT